MQSQLYVALSAQLSLSRRLDAIASNVANMNTPGYRADGTAFAAEVAKVGDSKVAYVATASNYISQRTGPLVKTDNPLDVAAQGDGWFAIQTRSGVAYTRDGRMTLAETGELRTLTGNAVLDAGGAPIILDPTAGPPTIANDGMIVQAGSQVGAIGLFSLADATALKRTENSGVIPNKPATPILDFTQNGLVQGAFEGSNINAIEEMTKLIGVTRTFDGVSSEVSHTESSLQDAIKTLAG
jgi:flagellar basal-body rod protein FlgF